MTGTEKVCPNCGSETFIAYQSVREVVIIDGEGDQIDVLKTVSSNRDEQIQCKSCQIDIESIENLVTAEYFHKIIAAGEKTDE